jgi:uncharacterized protein YjlB
MNHSEVQTFSFEESGGIPNNPRLPVLLYPGVLKQKIAQTEHQFNDNNWLNSWTNGIFAYHHYHSNAHEVLGVTGGFATVQLGGEEGQQLDIQAGDVLVLPAGTGHKRISSSPDFKVVGAYPDGMDYNTLRGNTGEKLKALEDIKQVPLPTHDPIFGTAGPLLTLWN